jgi:hypothetical protein
VDDEWEEVAKRIGGLGYAYANEESRFGPEGGPLDRRRLRRAMYLAIIAYTSNVPVYGSDVMVDGEPIGPHLGDGIAALEPHVSHAVATHQWVIGDPLVAPGVHLLPEMISDMQAGDELAAEAHENLIRFYQTQMSIIPNRRYLDDPDCRWGAILDMDHYLGAWSDANRGHRYRGLLGMLVIWGDYNRPITYVPYWYRGYFGDAAPADFSFSPGWSPEGILKDMHYWLDNVYVETRLFKQSGFQPDGTISHHIGHGTDASMVAYGFGWLEEPLVGFELYKNSPYRISDETFQFFIDRILAAYPKMVYNGWMDYIVSGRSYFSKLDQFAVEKIPDAIDHFLEVIPDDAELENLDKLQSFRDGLRDGSHQLSGNFPFWVNDYLVHRRGGGDEPSYFMSVRMESERTIGIEDFEKVRKSWHGGSGIFQVIVSGDEYNLTRRNMDWHALPGLTEEWRADDLPKASRKFPPRGGSSFAGVNSDGQYGFAAFEYRPLDSYAVAEADKAYFLTESEGIAIGRNVGRVKTGTGENIITTIDQAAWKTPITYSVDGADPEVVTTSESVDHAFEISTPSWFHQGEIGYVVIPLKGSTITLRTGDRVNVTDPGSSTGGLVFHLAIDHGVDPQKSDRTQYRYVLVPNVSAGEMPERMNSILENVHLVDGGNTVQGIHDERLGLTQLVFKESGQVQNDGIPVVGVNKAALVQIRENEFTWDLVITDPLHDENNRQIRVRTDIDIAPGVYAVSYTGVHPMSGEPVIVSKDADDALSLITVNLPHRDLDERYAHKSALYNGAPVVISLPKLK